MEIIGTLSKMGHETFGQVFPDGRVPLKSLETKQMNMVVDGKSVSGFFYFVDFSALNDNQRRDIRNYLHVKQKLRHDLIDSFLEAFQGTIPIRSIHISIAVEASDPIELPAGSYYPRDHR